MTAKDLQKIPLYMTRGISEARKQSPAAAAYIDRCYFMRYLRGDYGDDIDEDDTAANNRDLAAGSGHVLARYPAQHGLKEAIYIEAFFDKDHLQDIEYTNTLIMYVSER